MSARRSDNRLNAVINKFAMLMKNEREVAKKMDQLLMEYEMTKEQIDANYLVAVQIEEALQIESESIEELQQEIDTKTIELTRVNQQIRKFTKKSQQLSDKLKEDISLLEDDKNRMEKKKIKNDLFMRCTHLTLDADAPVHVVRGFISGNNNDEGTELTAFEFDRQQFASDEVVSDQIWQLVAKTSPEHMNVWNELFELPATEVEMSE